MSFFWQVYFWSIFSPCTKDVFWVNANFFLDFSFQYWNRYKFLKAKVLPDPNMIYRFPHIHTMWYKLSLIMIPKTTNYLFVMLGVPLVYMNTEKVVLGLNCSDPKKDPHGEGGGFRTLALSWVVSCSSRGHSWPSTQENGF